METNTKAQQPAETYESITSEHAGDLLLHTRRGDVDTELSMRDLMLLGSAAALALTMIDEPELFVAATEIGGRVAQAAKHMIATAGHGYQQAGDKQALLELMASDAGSAAALKAIDRLKELGLLMAQTAEAIASRQVDAKSDKGKPTTFKSDNADFPFDIGVVAVT